MRAEVFSPITQERHSVAPDPDAPGVWVCHCGARVYYHEGPVPIPKGHEPNPRCLAWIDAEAAACDADPELAARQLRAKTPQIL